MTTETFLAPQVVLGRWFPADVVLPGRVRPWHNVYALCTERDLAVWTRPAEHPEWLAALDGQPALPVTDMEAKRGFDVRTAAGLAVITLGSGCRCGSLGKWPGPSWARMERVR